MKMVSTNARVIIVLLMVVFSTSCTDLSGVLGRLDDHDKRLNALEKMVSDANTNIQTLQKLMDAVSSKISIVSCDPTKDGYVLKMSDGSEIVLKNGQDGNSPVIGVKEENGVLYWTINGEFMQDADGQKIKAEGQDGVSGMTPKIRVDAEGYWEVSMDDGKTWQAITDAIGNKVKAVGSDANVDLVITEDENAITIIYKGSKFVIPKEGGTTPDPKPVDRPKLPIEYFAEYDLAQDGKSFVTTHANEAPGLFQWETSVKYFGEVTINGKRYRVPTQGELHVIVGKYGIEYMEPDSGNDLGDGEITVNGKTLLYDTDYKCVQQYIVYAIRFKGNGNEWLSAYRYEYKDNPDSAEGKMLEVRVRYLGPESTVTIDDISVESYWSSNGEGDVIRVFPASGWKNQWQDTRYNVGIQGSFFSCSETVASGHPYSMDFQANRVYMYESNERMDYAALRLIEVE